MSDDFTQSKPPYFSKEQEIALKHINRGMAVTIENSPLGEAMLNRVVEAMNEYAKQQAIGFATWCDDECLTRGLNLWHCLDNPEISNRSDDELYEFYITTCKIEK